MSSSLSHKIYNNVDSLTHEWDNIDSNIFLNLAYLNAQSNASPANIDYFYIALYDNHTMVGKSVVQRIQLKGNELYRNANASFREDLINLLNLNLLCVGNIKVTGEHAYVFSDSRYLNQGIKEIQKALNIIRKQSKKDGLPIQLMLFKDFYVDSADEVSPLLNGYKKLSVQPNMVFSVNPEWTLFEDYLLAMRTKYRTRAKRAFKMGQGIDYQIFNSEDIQNHRHQIYDLYNNVLDSNGFSMYKLPKSYFEEMQRELKGNFHFVAGFLDSEMVSFYTIITNRNRVEAGFLGYDKLLQQEKQLYLNMLYQMIRFSIENNYHQIDFSRTALEIKSSVGAEPVEMYGFLKHNQPLMNKILQSTFNKFYQPKEWMQRKPFKN